MTNEKLDELEALLAKATPGEWTHTMNPEVSRWIIDSQPGHAIACGAGYEPTTVANAALIVALHNAVPGLISAARQSAAMAEQLAERDARIAVLEGVLRPLADACEKADKSAADRLHLGMGVMSDTASPGWGVKYSHLKAARAALTVAP